jgi:hypothetical protein
VCLPSQTAEGRETHRSRDAERRREPEPAEQHRPPIRVEHPHHGDVVNRDRDGATPCTRAGQIDVIGQQVGRATGPPSVEEGGDLFPGFDLRTVQIM